MKTETYTLPAYWASYLVNGDGSGLEDEEITEIDAWCERERHRIGAEFDTFVCVDCSEESEFSWHNDATTMGGDVLDYTFQVS